MDVKYLILDMGKVLVGPTTGNWLITPAFLENVDMSKIDKLKLKEAMEEFNYILGKKMLTLDEEFFYITCHKQFCESKGFYKRTILTLFGEITFKRRYYYDKKYNDRFNFTDFFLGLPKRKYFDPLLN